MTQIHVIHYMNQFFAGIGGEEKADTPPGSHDGPIGPGRRLQALLGDSVEIVASVYCGDDYFAANTDDALASILEVARDRDIELVVAGPAFASGRHGFACAEVCHMVSSTLGIDGVTAMSPDNPGVDMYRLYKDRRVYLLPAAESGSGMEDALKKLAQFLLKLASGQASGPPSI